MISTKAISASLILRNPLSRAIQRQTARRYAARIQSQNTANTTTKRYMSEKPDASLEDVTRSLSVLSNSQSEESVMELAERLSPEARREIVNLFSTATEGSAAAAANAVPHPSYNDLKLIALAQAIPFLGFGFMDNAILILAGDAIDTSLGVALGISTLCAAAIGNIISDVAGIMLGTVIEDFCTHYLKLPMPNLTTAQRQLRSVRFANQFGCGVGIVIGCIIGMFPLLFLDPNKNQKLKRDAALQKIFRDIMSEARTLIGAQSANMFLLVDKVPDKDGTAPVPNPDGRFLYVKYLDSDSGEVSHRSFKFGKGIVSRSALTGQTWNIKDVETEPDFSPEMQKDKVKNLVCVPVLNSEGKTFAVIRAYNKIEEGTLGSPTTKKRDSKEIQRQGFTANDVQVLQALASHISVSLQHMYQEREADESIGVKETIRILKEHGLAGIAEEKPTPFSRRQSLFPEEEGGEKLMI